MFKYFSLYVPMKEERKKKQMHRLQKFTVHESDHPVESVNMCFKF